MLCSVLDFLASSEGDRTFVENLPVGRLTLGVNVGECME
jgi:hypothetical protein